MKRFYFICLILFSAILVKAQTGWLNYAGAKNYAMWTTKWLQADNAFYWKGDTINKGLLVYADLKPDSIRFKRIGGTWSDWYYSGRSAGGGIALTDLSATSPILYDNTTGVFSMASNAYAAYGTVSFPGFGTSHSLAAYGDHDHSTVYAPITGSANYIQNQNASAQTANMWINGKIGSGPITPATKLHISGTTSADYIQSDVGINIKTVASPAAGSVALINTAGNVDAGTHYYLVSFTTALGETNAYGIGNVTTDAANGQVTVTIPVSTDYRVTGRKIYRTKAGGSSYQDYILTTIANNTATTYIDNIADASLTGSASSGYFRVNTTNSQILLNGNVVMRIDANATHFGVGSGNAITTGGRNCLFGSGAGAALNTGMQNCLFGNSAGGLLTSGTDNVIIGQTAGQQITTGNGNVLIGRNTAGNSTLGSVGNVAVGNYSLWGGGTNNSSKSNNTAIGASSGNNVVGSNNVFIGYAAGYYESGSSKLFIDNTNRSNEADARIKALVYGVFASTPATQIFTVNAKLGVNSAPTAWLHLPAGTATASTSPLKFTSGTNLTTPEAGAMEYDGTNLYFTPAAARKTIAFTDHTHTGTYEPVLGNPSVNGYILSSTTAGVRSWVPNTAGDNYGFWGFQTNGGIQTVPSANTVSFVNGTGFAFTNTGLSITGTNTAPMVYPGAGIPISTGSAWGTSITNNSANWNTAYGWGNHAGLYVPIANNNKVALNSSPSSGDYLNGSWFTAGANGFVPVIDTYVTNGEAAPPSSNAVYDELQLKANLSGATFTGAIYGTSATFTGALNCAEGYRGYSDIRLKNHIRNIKSNISKVRFYQFEFKNDSTNRKHYGVIAQQVEKYMPELVTTDDKGIKSVAYIDLLIAKIAELEKRIKTLENEK